MGISYNVTEGKFIFDFNHDGVTDVIPLTLHGYQVEAFGKCFYYGYEFADDVDGNVRSAFIKHLKFPAVLKEDPDLTHFSRRPWNLCDILRGRESFVSVQNQKIQSTKV